MDNNVRNIIFEKSFENSPLPKTITVFETGEYIKVNKSFINLVGYTEEEILGGSVLSLNIITPEIRKELYDKVLIDGQIVNKEMYIKSKTGEERLCLFSTDLSEIEGKKYLFTVLTDISETKRLQDLLIESEEKFKNIFYQSPIGISLYEENGDLKMINDSNLKMLGLESKDDIKNFNLFHQKDPNDIIKKLNYKESVEREVTVDFDNTYIKSTNIGIHYFKIIVIKYKFNGSSYMGMMQDITEQKMQYAKLKEQEEKLKNIIDKSPIGVEIYDVNGNLIDVNKACIDIFGVIDKSQIMGFNLFEDPNLPKNIKNILEKKKKWEGNIKFEFDDVIKNNLYETTEKGIKYLDVIITKQNISTDATYIVQIHNVTKNTIQKNKLEELNLNKDKFFSIISHDLKSPFNAILGFTDILYDDYFSYSDEERIGFIKNIKDAGNNAFELLQNLLDWSITQTNKIKFHPQHTDISNIINDVVKLMNSQSLIKNIKIYSSVKYNTYCYVDSNMLKVILRNLISNSIKFTEEGGEVKISDEYIVKDDKLFIKINVNDTGIGIIKENINNLFKIEEKTMTLGTNKEKGTGLGLVICKEYVEKNNGEIWVESEVGFGSTFSFTIPIEP